MTLLFGILAVPVSGSPGNRLLGACMAHIILIAVTLSLAINLILQCNHKARQYNGSRTTLFRYLQVTTGLLAVFCFLDMVEYATLLPHIKSEAPYSLILTQFQLDIAGPAKAFYYLADGLIFMILVRVGLSLGGHQNQHRTPYWRIARILSPAIPFMLLVLVLTHIGYLCEFVSSISGPSANLLLYDTLFTALRVDLACSALVLGLSCMMLTHAASIKFTLHGFSVNKFSSGQTLYTQCSVLWALQAILYTTFVCICYIYYWNSLSPANDGIDCMSESEPESYVETAVCILSHLPGSYFYFFHVILVAGSKYIILHLLLNRSHVNELVEFFVDEDVELDTVSNASSEYS